MFYAKIFKNTGFNLVNIPESIEKLMELYVGVDYPSLDILQLYHNDIIKIKVDHGEADVIEADFLILADNVQFNGRLAAYAIQDYEMTSGDVAELNVAMEPFLSAGGINNIKFLDGTTTRHHVSPDLDSWGTYVEEDPLLVPSHAPKMEFIGDYFSEREGSTVAGNGYLIVETVNEIQGNFDINNMVDLALANDGSFLTALSTNQYNGVQFTNWKSTPPAIGITRDYNAGYLGSGYTPENGNTMGSLTTYAVASENEMITGNAIKISNFIDHLKILFEWGMSGIIKNAYYIPRFWRLYGLNFTIKSGNDRGIIETINATPLHRETAYLSPEIHLDEDILTDKNVRAYYGSNRQIIAVATGTGEIISKNPEMVMPVSPAGGIDLYRNPASGISKAANVKNAKIVVFGWADPRAGGCPKFHLLGVDDPYLTGHPEGGYCFKDFIKGQQWGSIPIGLNATAGAGQAAINYSSQKALSDWNTIFGGNSDAYQNSRLSGKGYNIGGWVGPKTLISGIGDVLANSKASAARAYEEDRFSGSPFDFGRNSLDQMNDWGKGNLYGSKRSQAYAQREMQARSEALQYVVSQVPQPIMAFDASSNMDPSGNGILLFRMVPDGRDVAKYEKVLNQYGYRITEPIQEDFMKNRPLYNYIQATGVSCKAEGIPKSVRDDLSVAFAQGLRIWHVKPDPNEYNTTNNKTTPMS